MSIFKKNKSGNVRLGDAARDKGTPHLAVKYYEMHLSENGNDAAIWVQCGNAYKDSGNYNESHRCYERALEITPNDYDIYVQKGHLYKLKGDFDLSRISYQKAIDINPECRSAMRELISMGTNPVVNKNLVDLMSCDAAIYIDVTDLLIYVRHNNTLSGIQRVVANLVAHGYSESYGRKIVPITPDIESNSIYGLNISTLIALIDLYGEGVLDRSLADKTIDLLYANKFEVSPVRGDVITNAGAFWIYNNFDMFRELRREGVKYCVFIHDLIQISYPQYVSPDARIEFQTRLIDVLSVCDFVLTNSHYVAGDVNNYIKANLNYSIPVYAVPLPTELKKIDATSNKVRREIKHIADEEYVLCVSTLEIRKNHRYLISIWEKLIANSKLSIPKLVLVGKWGWQIDDFKSYIEEMGYEGDWLIILSDIGDADLEYLYRNCLFTAYTSFAEGFGLPIGESLVYGKPCIASNTTSMPEVGGDFVKYIDPLNVDSGFKVFSDVLNNRAELKQWEKRIQSDFSSRTWAEFTGEYYRQIIKNVDNSSGAQDFECLIPEGELFYAGLDAVLNLADNGGKIITINSTRAYGWHPYESWGVWSSERRSAIKFKTNISPGKKIRVFLEICRSPASKNGQVVIDGGDGLFSFKLSSSFNFVRFDAAIDAKGLVSVVIVAKGGFEKTDHRYCYIGLRSLGYCASDDIGGRLNIVEKILLER